jgi:polysaccharide export outer membrane protein
VWCWALALAAASGCAHRQPAGFIWIEDVPKGMLATGTEYEIAPGDVIGVRVWNLEANSVDRARVRQDGKISMPFLNDVEVAGLEPATLARRLEVKLKEYIQNPSVTVVVHERRPIRISILGKVVRPGIYDLDDGAGMAQALASAGGLTAFADPDGLFVLRSGYWADGDPSAGRIRFHYEDIKQGRAPGAAFQLRRGDVIVVE